MQQDSGVLQTDLTSRRSSLRAGLTNPLQRAAFPQSMARGLEPRETPQTRKRGMIDHRAFSPVSDLDEQGVCSSLRSSPIRGPRFSSSPAQCSLSLVAGSEHCRYSGLYAPDGCPSALHSFKLLTSTAASFSGVHTVLYLLNLFCCSIAFFYPLLVLTSCYEPFTRTFGTTSTPVSIRPRMTSSILHLSTPSIVCVSHLLQSILRTHVDKFRLAYFTLSF